MKIKRRTYFEKSLSKRAFENSLGGREAMKPKTYLEKSLSASKFEALVRNRAEDDDWDDENEDND